MHWSVNENTVTRCCNPVFSLGSVILHSPIQHGGGYGCNYCKQQESTAFSPVEKSQRKGYCLCQRKDWQADLVKEEWELPSGSRAGSQVQGPGGTLENYWERHPKANHLSFIEQVFMEHFLSVRHVGWGLRVEDRGRWGHREKTLDAKLRSLNLIPHARENHQKLLGRSKEELNIQE